MAVAHPTRETYSSELDALLASSTDAPSHFSSSASHLTLDLERLFTTTPSRRDTGPLEGLDESGESFLDDDDEREENNGIAEDVPALISGRIKGVRQASG